jgi:hypothetical protein
MKFGVTISASLHSAIVAWALVSLGGPPALVMLEDKGVEVDFAALTESNSGQGEREAEVDPTPTPLPSKRPQTVPDAENFGEANEDSPSREGIVTDKPLDTEKVSPAPEADEVVNAPEIVPEPVISPDRIETPVPTTEVARLNEPRVPVTDDAEPVEEQSAINPEVENPQSETVPVPVRAPDTRPKPNNARTTERKNVEEPKRRQTATSTQKREELTDEIGRLLNTQDNTAGGARRETEMASIGNSEPVNAPELTQGEYEALKGRISSCWSTPIFVDTGNLEVVLLMQMTRDGYMADIVDIQVTGTTKPADARAIEGGLRRTLDRSNCDFSGVLPREKYETWKDIKVNFDPSDF